MAIGTLTLGATEVLDFHRGIICDSFLVRYPRKILPWGLLKGALTAIMKLGGGVFLLVLMYFRACKFSLSCRKYKRKHQCLILVWCHFAEWLALLNDHYMMLPFQSNLCRTRTPYLVVHILDDKENRTVERCWFTVQSLQAGPVLQCTVRKPPRVSLHSRGQAPGKLGNEQWKKETYSTGCVTAGAPDYSLSAGASEPKNGCQRSSWCQQLNSCATCMCPCTLSSTVCVYITSKLAPLSKHTRSCQSSWSQLKTLELQNTKISFPREPVLQQTGLGTRTFHHTKYFPNY